MAPEKNNEASNIDKKQMLEQKLQLWKNTIYDAEVDARVAQAIGDDQLLETAKRRLGQAIKATDVVGKILAELEE